MSNKKRITILQVEIEKEINLLRNSLLKTISDQTKYIKRLEKNLNYIRWVNKKFKISTSKRKYTVAQREIYHCHLGVNIGSEQGETRPVVILQNNFGNKSGNTTVVAPITSHEKSVQYDNITNKYYVDVFDKNGIPYRKYLDYYEIPVIIENNSKIKICGFINISHIREVDRKRICGKRVAMVTETCFKEIKDSIFKNFR